MNLIIFTTMLFGLQLLYWMVGRRAAKKLSGNDDYFLAGKSVSFFPLMMTFLATQVGGGLVLGAADEAFKFGWGVLFYPLGHALGLILLGLGVGKRLAQFPVSTVAQIFEVAYRSPFLKKVASVLSIISLFMILVAQIIASHKFLMSLGINSTPLFCAFWGIVILYTAQGGLRAVISTDMVQAGVFTAIFFVALGFTLPGELPNTLMQWSGFEAISSKLWGWLLMPLLFVVIEQDMAQRCFAGNSPKVISKATLFAGVATLVICTIPIFFGVLGKSLGVEVTPGSSVLMAVIEKMTNPWIAALVGCAILAAIISTATSLISAISSNLFSDFKRQSVKTMQIMTCALSATALVFAFYFNSIVDILIQSYELSVSCLLVPIVFALIKRQGNFISALLALSMGCLGFIFFRIFPIEFPKEIASILLSLLGYGAGELIARTQLKESW